MAEKNQAPVVAFFDVDGTLTCRDFNDGLRVVPTQGVQGAIRAFADAGNVAVLCSGRSILNVVDLRHLPFAGYVTLAGTHVVLNDEVVYDRTIGRDTLRRTVEEMRRAGVEALFEGTYGNVMVRCGLNSMPYCDDVADIEDYERAGGRMDFGKIDFTDDCLEACLASDYLMSTYVHFDVADGNHELAIPGTSKGVGGQALLDALPFTPSRVFAFGDSENDLPMRGAVETFVAMGNALENVRAVADYVTGTAAEEGVPAALERFGLI